MKNEPSTLNRPGGPAGRRGLRLAAAAAAAVTLLAAACSAPAVGSRSAGFQQSTLTVELDWVPNPDHTGLYYAQQKGYFIRQHLSVSFQVPSSAADPLKLVGLGKADLAISYEPELFYGQQEHLPVTAVAAVIPVPLNGLIVSPRLHLAGPCGIRGHSVGFTGLPSDFAFYDTLLHTCGLSRRQVPYQTVGYSLVQSVLAGKVDSIIGGYRNVEAIQISLQTRQRAADFPANEFGVPPYDELVLVANATRLRSGPGYARAVRRFLAAFVAGTAAAARDPGAATAVMRTASQYPQRFLRVSVPYTLRLLGQHPGLRYGCMSPAAWARFGAWLEAHRLVRGPARAAAIMTDRYLPYRSCRTAP